MKCIIVKVKPMADIQAINSTHPFKQMVPVQLTDKTYVLEESLQTDPYWSDWQGIIGAEKAIEVEELKWPDKAFAFLCARDSRSVVTPEDGYTWWQYYVSTGDLPAS